MTPLLSALLDPAAYPHPALKPRLLETHISWVILAGDYAYKLKKPLDLGFLDFSSLAKREYFCHEEVRLNSRLAPDIYLGVVPIVGSPARIGEEDAQLAEPVLEWAVKMRAFPAEATLDRVVDIRTEQIDRIADRVAIFHAGITKTPESCDFGSPAAVAAPVAENFRQLRALLAPRSAPNAAAPLLDRLEAWSLEEGRRLAEHFAARKAGGYIRECHGDLHLGNIAWVTGPGASGPIIFDGIEFNPGLRHIDLISEVAFLCMDLVHRDRAALAWRFLDRYLQHTGDYAGLAALPYYMAYRAVVRAKVAAILASEQAAGAADFSQARGYLELAERFSRRPSPMLLLMHGVSGAGKTWFSQALLERLPGDIPCVRLRSDVERKRLFGLAPLADSRVLQEDIYSREAGERTLARLLTLSRELLSQGFRVIVDATFIKRNWRAPFQDLAEAHAQPWFIVALEATVEVLQQRVLARQAQGRDASEADLAVIAAQRASIDPFTADELSHVLRPANDPGAFIDQLQARLP